MTFLRCASLLAVSAVSVGWVWNTPDAPPGPTFTYHLCNGDFSAGQKTEIELAADGWLAGYGRPIRGANWRFIRGADVTGCAADNGVNEISSAPQLIFTLLGLGSALAVTTPPGAMNDDIDVIFNEGHNWANVVPSATVSTQRSFGQVALHEFGHVLGLLHETGVVATMNPNYPAGGDLSAFAYRPHEDDYSGLAANRYSASTGVNLLLGRFSLSGGELWDQATSAWDVCQEIVASPDGPEQIYAVVLGTGTVSPTIEWWLSADNDCHNGTKYPVGSRTPTMSANTPYLVHPNPYDFRYVPEGSYYLCAMIDPDDDYPESYSGDSDNDLVSEVTVTVKDCN